MQPIRNFMQNLFSRVLYPPGRRGPLGLVFDVPGIVRALAWGLVPEPGGHLAVVRSMPLEPCRIGHAQAVQGGRGTDQAVPLKVAQVVAHAGLHVDLALPRRAVAANGDQGRVTTSEAFVEPSRAE
jgi:hypothetical protein